MIPRLGSVAIVVFPEGRAGPMRGFAARVYIGINNSLAPMTRGDPNTFTALLVARFP